MLGLGGGRRDRKEGICGHWLQLISDGKSTVQLSYSAQLWLSVATSCSRSQQTLVPELPFCKDLGGELAGSSDCTVSQRDGKAGVRRIGKERISS